MLVGDLDQSTEGIWYFLAILADEISILLLNYRQIGLKLPKIPTLSEIETSSKHELRNSRRIKHSDRDGRFVSDQNEATA